MLLGWNTCLPIDFDIEDFGWETCEVEKESIILLIFPCGVLLMSVDPVDFIHQSAVTNFMQLQSTYTPHLQ